MNIIFMGTPDFSVGTLEALIEAGHDIKLVVTQPDKPKGRGKSMQFTPVKECALAHDLPVFQPVKIRDSEAVAYLEQFDVDCMVVVAFGQILPQVILDTPKYGCVNVHASLLPKYRGAAPIQASILHGDAVTGVTTMQMDAGMDTGDILLVDEYTIGAKETGGSLFDHLSQSGAKLCVKTLEGLEAGTITPLAQDDSKATYTSMISKKDGELDFSQPAKEIECRIRAMSPWPSAFTRLGKKTLKVWDAEVLPDQDAKAAAGTIIKVEKDAIYVQTGEGVLRFNEIQLEGKKRMTCDAFLRGYPVEEGTLLG